MKSQRRFSLKNLQLFHLNDLHEQAIIRSFRFVCFLHHFGIYFNSDTEEQIQPQYVGSGILRLHSHLFHVDPATKHDCLTCSANTECDKMVEPRSGFGDFKMIFAGA